VTPPSQATAAPVSGQRSGRLQAGSARSGGLQAANARSADLKVGIDGLKSAATPAATLRLVESYGKLPLSFEANQGQTDSQVKFLSRGRGYTLFLTGDEAVLALPKPSGISNQSSVFRNAKIETRNSAIFNLQSEIPNRQSLLPSPTDNGLRAVGNRQSPIGNSPAPGPESRAAAVLRLKLLGANPNARVTGLDPLPGKSNYFLGNDPKKWRTNVPNYAKVQYKGIYPGIDLIYYGNQGKLEYDFVVAPDADPAAIRLAVETGPLTPSPSPRGRGWPGGPGEGAPPRIDSNGDLVIQADAGDVRFHKPVVYQPSPSPGSRVPSPDPPVPALSILNRQSSIDNRQFLDGRYTITARNQVAFEIPAYDRTRPLVIDPLLSYSTYLGLGTARGIAVDSPGNAYLVGYTPSMDFPTTPGAVQTTFAGEPYDAFVTKFDASGSALTYSTYLGGSNTGPKNTGQDYGVDISVDSAGNAYVTGWTNSRDFPVTPDAFRTAIPPGGSDWFFFVAKLNATGSALVYSTYLGGSSGLGAGIAVDSAGNAYVTGVTGYTDFPTTPGVYQSTFGGVFDAFVTKLNPTGSTLIYSTYLGGSGDDRGNDIALDSGAYAYVAGNGFVTKLNAAGSGLIYSTSVGAFCYGVAVDSADNAYVTGSTYHLTGSTDSPGAFVAKLDATGSITYSLYLGGSVRDIGRAVAVDSYGNAYVTGSANSPTQFPTTADAFQTTFGGGTYDAFLSKLNPTGSTLIYSTYLGGSYDDQGYGISLDSAGNAYITGLTNSLNFPTTPGAFQTTSVGGYVFAAKFSSLTLPAVSLSATSVSFGNQVIGTTSTGQTLTLTNAGDAPLTLSGIVATSDFAQTNNCPLSDVSLAPGASCSISVTFTPAAIGTRTGKVTITDNASGSPHQVSLTGNGTSGAVSLSSSMLTFGNQMVGTNSEPQTLILSNSGGTLLTIMGVATSGDFAQTNDCPISPVTLGAGASCTFSVTFHPTATGTQVGALTIRDSAPGSPHVVSLTGTGVAPAVTLSAASLTFANQAVGTTSAPQTVTLSNTGTALLTITSIAASGDYIQSNTCGLSVDGGPTVLSALPLPPRRRESAPEV
jgi:hypothetical protein